MTYELFTKQLDGCAYHSGGDNCTCGCHGSWLYRASQGAIKLTACQVRRETGDDIAGTNLTQMQAVSIKHGIPGGRLYKPGNFDTIAALVKSGRYGSHLNVSYSPLANTKYDCFDGNFRGNHDLYLSRGTATTAHVMDPGADGRRPSIPKGYQDIPWSLLKRAAALLDLGRGVTIASKYGSNACFAYVTPADPVFPTQEYTVHIDGYVSLYARPNGVRVGAVSQATYVCTRAKVDGEWWFHIKATASGKASPNVGRYFQPNRYVEAYGRG